MTRLGVLARADDGGLGNQTREVIRHLKPAAVLTILLGEHARGREDQQRVAQVADDARWVGTNPGPRLFDEILDEFLSHIDVLYTIEGPYHLDLLGRCHAHGVRLVIHANPELYRDWPCDDLWTPTTWRHACLVNPQLVPFPVALDRFEPSQPSEPPTFLHLGAPAMLDRQGTQLVCEAFALVRNECRILMRLAGVAGTDQYGAALVEWLPPTAEYWDAYPAGAWALIQPRRYGGLSLPIQEAAACGMPTLALDREPEASDYRELTVRFPVGGYYDYAMAGGEVMVENGTPERLAALIDTSIESLDWPGARARCRAWAKAHSWASLEPLWRKRLGL